ncbi:hypothetical protein ACFQO9_03835 [Chryseobacterium zhengzhouense]|uniref:Uncharacterized protein n=1 Tax=Chryseobacterium zhengzhouense TaxID=1636086 RepID=A0ABW2LWE1_9FLAO
MGKQSKFYIQNSAISIIPDSKIHNSQNPQTLPYSNFFRSREPAFTTRFFMCLGGGFAAAEAHEKSSNTPFNQG